MLRSEFEAFLAEEIAKQKGVYYPVKANMVERLSITTAPPKQLHPNPMDDFCRAEVGPSYLIINEYVKKIRDTPDFASSLFDEPILVEKVRPDGYRILNGHHRWAAALNVGVKKVPIDIVNLAHSTDIRKVLERSQHDRRVTFDMDEVILHPKGDVPMEEPLGFPYNIRYKKQKRIRLGVPALFDFLKKTGYDIWLYSSEYYSIEDIKDFFRCYSSKVDGVITGVGRAGGQSARQVKKTNAMFAEKYKFTLHVDNESVLLTRGRKKAYEEFAIDGTPAEWSGRVMDVVDKVERQDKEAEEEKKETV